MRKYCGGLRLPKLRRSCYADSCSFWGECCVHLAIIHFHRCHFMVEAACQRQKHMFARWGDHARSGYHAVLQRLCALLEAGQTSKSFVQTPSCGDLLYLDLDSRDAIERRCAGGREGNLSIASAQMERRKPTKQFLDTTSWFSFFSHKFGCFEARSACSVQLAVGRVTFR